MRYARVKPLQRERSYVYLTRAVPKSCVRDVVHVRWRRHGTERSRTSARRAQLRAQMLAKRMQHSTLALAVCDDKWVVILIRVARMNNLLRSFSRTNLSQKSIERRGANEPRRQRRRQIVTRRFGRSLERLDVHLFKLQLIHDPRIVGIRGEGEAVVRNQIGVIQAPVGNRQRFAWGDASRELQLKRLCSPFEFRVPHRVRVQRVIT